MAPPPLLQSLYNRLPTRLRILPLPAIRIILFLSLINILVWVVTSIILRYHPLLSSTALLAYTFGLRHALDADHISAIDLMTRRLIASGRYKSESNECGAKGPVTVGTWFSLGHSTIVIITCIVVAATSGALEHRFDNFERIGGIIGTSVSASVLILLGIGNLIILIFLIQKIRKLLNRVEVSGHEDRGESEDGKGELDFAVGGGIMVRVFRRVFKIVDRPWKMYPMGVLFGLGFDTSSEIALIGIAGLQGAQGTSLWLIMIFPVLFTAGMCLIDTTDGALMMTLYTSTSLARDTIAVLYYSIVLTGVTVMVATCIGTIQLLTLILNVANPTGKFWDGVATAGDNFEIIGGAICGAFVFFGLGSVIMYGPWRRRFDRRQISTPGLSSSGDGDEIIRSDHEIASADDIETGNLEKLAIE